MPTKIPWAEETWNFVTGCSRVSAGCAACYAERLSLAHNPGALPWTAANADINVVEHFDRLDKPRSWKTSKRIFVNSMADLYHPNVSDKILWSSYNIMEELPRHQFLVLTKRPERALEWANGLGKHSRTWARNIWMGVSIEDQKNLGRLDTLKRHPAVTRFVSFEPLLGPIGPVDLSGISWVIVGGESGNDPYEARDAKKFRGMDHAWAREIRDQCREQSVPFFFKQSAGKYPDTGIALVEEDGSSAIARAYPEVMGYEPPEQLSLF